MAKTNFTTLFTLFTFRSIESETHTHMLSQYDVEILHFFAIVAIIMFNHRLINHCRRLTTPKLVSRFLGNFCFHFFISYLVSFLFIFDVEIGSFFPRFNSHKDFYFHSQSELYIQFLYIMYVHSLFI